MKVPVTAGFPFGELRDCSISYIVKASNKPVPISNRYGFKIVIGLDGTFDSEINGRVYKGIRGFVIDRNVNHFCHCGGVSMFVSLIEPKSRWGQSFKALLAGNDFLDIEELLPGEEIDAILPLRFQELGRDALAERVQAFFLRIFRNNADTQLINMDSRVSEVLLYIDRNLAKNIELAEVANLVHLSPHRFRHLFAEQIGMPFTQYIIWQRLRKSIYAVASGQMTLGNTVENFGFTDQAHFSNTFKKMFGVFPRVFLHTCYVIC
ncbi:AraC family transcriptional regulator [Dyadobacter sp. 676]|uniref:AraC family transcriptional regulator n=1 Tax=Dyadobacter sp. 676 TaxID=3088362 RepID=A0AAU8FJX5_9BACT